MNQATTQKLKTLRTRASIQYNCTCTTTPLTNVKSYLLHLEQDVIVTGVFCRFQLRVERESREDRDKKEAEHFAGQIN